MALGPRDEVGEEGKGQIYRTFRGTVERADVICGITGSHYKFLSSNVNFLTCCVMTIPAAVWRMDWERLRVDQKATATRNDVNLISELTLEMQIHGFKGLLEFKSTGLLPIK